MTITIDPAGNVRCIYTEDFPLESLGRITDIRRASHVEPTTDCQWVADMSPCNNGPVLGPFATRSLALAAEVAWLEAHHL